MDVIWISETHKPTQAMPFPEDGALSEDAGHTARHAREGPATTTKS